MFPTIWNLSEVDPAQIPLTNHTMLSFRAYARNLFLYLKELFIVSFTILFVIAFNYF